MRNTRKHLPGLVRTSFVHLLYFLRSLGHLFSHREEEDRGGRLPQKGETFAQILQERFLTRCFDRLQILCKLTKLSLHLFYLLGILNHSRNFFHPSIHSLTLK